MITVAAVADRIGMQELLMNLAGRVDGDLDDEVFRAVIDEADLSEFQEDMVAVATAGVARLQMAIDAATRLINGYVAKRYPNGLSPSQIDSSPLPDIALVLVKHELMVTTDEDTRNNHKAAMAQLRDISSGALSLGADDPAKPSDARIVVGGGYSGFDWSGFGK